MADYQRWSWGGLSFPLGTATGNKLLRDADPSLFYAIDYFAFMIETYLGARLVAELTDAKVVGSDNQPIARAVRTALPVDPKEHAVSAQYPPPLLAIWRERSASEQRTVVHAIDATTWRLLYLLPPLTAAQSEAIEPILHAVEIVLQHATETGWDPAYVPPEYVPPPGGDPNPQAWKLAGLERISFESADYGQLPDLTGQIWAPSLLATLRVKERGTSIPGTPLQGATVTLAVQPPDGSDPLKDVVDVETWVPIPKPGP